MAAEHRTGCRRLGRPLSGRSSFSALRFGYVFVVCVAGRPVAVAAGEEAVAGHWLVAGVPSGDWLLLCQAAPLLVRCSAGTA